MVIVCTQPREHKHFWQTFTDFALTCMPPALCARIAGNGASEKNLKDGVCAQFKKNFAKAKWRV